MHQEGAKYQVIQVLSLRQGTQLSYGYSARVPGLSGVNNGSRLLFWEGIFINSVYENDENDSYARNDYISWKGHVPLTC